MKREIKFRGLDIDSKQWVYGYYTIESNKPYIEVVGMSEMFNAFEVLPESVGQYTGLKDKNGVEIYEGDIVELKSSRYTFIENGIVDYNNGAFIYKHIKDGSSIALYMLNTKECTTFEIIGNIHQNPELL